MSCINLSVAVYPLSFPSASCTSRTVLAPWRHRTARIAISASVGSGGESGSSERGREGIAVECYTNIFVCQRNCSYVNEKVSVRATSDSRWGLLAADQALSSTPSCVSSRACWHDWMPALAGWTAPRHQEFLCANGNTEADHSFRRSAFSQVDSHTPCSPA